MLKLLRLGSAVSAIVMREEADVLFGFLARAQIADGDGVMRLAGEIDGAQDEFDRDLEPSAWRSSASTG